MKNLLISFFAAFVLVLVFSTSAQAAGELRVSVTNTTQTSDSTLTFEVRLLNTTDSTFEYATGQYYYDFNKAILNGGTGVLTILSSDLATAMRPRNLTVNVSGSTGILQFATNSEPGGGSGKVINAHTTILIMKVQLRVRNAKFAQLTPNILNREYVAAAPVSPYSSITYYVGVQYWDENLGDYAINYTNTNATFNGNTVFINDTYNPTLPVELQSFTANVKQRDVELKWHTATEVGVSHFEIQRSVAGSSQWSTVNANVPATGGSNAPKDYSFTDKKLKVGDYTYRLKMVDNDGSFQYSKQTVSGSVATPKSFELSQNYPNPFNPSTKIDYQVPMDAKVSLELYSVNGQKVATLVNEQQSAGYYTYAFTANSASAGLASGLYIYRVVAEGVGTSEKFVSVKKMILLK